MTAAWQELSAGMRSCTRCAELVGSRTQVVVGDGPVHARLALVGEAPGAQEDLAGRPFVGRAGQLLDETLAGAGLARDEVAVLNVLKCRPPRNRAPRSVEVTACRPWLAAQLDLLAPELVVTLGLWAARWFFGPRVRLGEIRGTVHQVAGRPVLATYHPSAAIRFGPAGAPLAALREDLAAAARWVRP